MKPPRALVAAGLLFSASSAMAQQAVLDTAPALPRNALIANFGELFNGGMALDYERGLVDWLGLSLGIGIRGFDGPFDLTNTWRTSVSSELGVRFHLTGAAPGGFWLGPTVKGAALITKEAPPPRPVAWGLGVAAGYHFVILPNCVFQLGGSVGFMDAGRGVVWEPRLRLGLGFVL